MTIDDAEFIRRFLLHALPQGFQRIRHFGFLANRHRSDKLAVCRKLLANLATELLPQPEQCRQLPPQPSQTQQKICPNCGKGVMIRLGIVAAGYRWPERAPDSS